MNISNVDIRALAEAVIALREGWEFHTFWLGTRLRGPMEERAAAEAKREANRAVGLRVLERCPDLHATPEDPQAQIVLEIASGRATIKARPLFAYGRYRKLARDIPQSKWHCRRCRGRGCEACGGTGRRYTESVEENISAVVRKQ
jgi:tRNA pseudouridine synthase 10